MKSKVLWTLAGLNVLLAAVFVGRMTRDNAAMAQTRRPADVLAIPGETLEDRSSVVYLLDTNNGQLGGMVYNTTRKSIDIMPPIDLARVFDAAAGGRPKGSGN